MDNNTISGDFLITFDSGTYVYNETISNVIFYFPSCGMYSIILSLNILCFNILFSYKGEDMETGCGTGGDYNYTVESSYEASSLSSYEVSSESSNAASSYDTNSEKTSNAYSSLTFTDDASNSEKKSSSSGGYSLLVRLLPALGIAVVTLLIISVIAFFLIRRRIFASKVEVVTGVEDVEEEYM